MSATRKVSYHISTRFVNVQFFILPKGEEAHIPELLSGSSSLGVQLVRRAYNAAIRRKGDTDTNALYYAYLSPNNIQDNAHIAYLAYVDALANPVYDSKNPCVPLSPSKSAYRALSRHIYANKQRKAVYNPDKGYSAVMQGEKLVVVARDAENMRTMVRDLLSVPCITEYLKKHPERRDMLSDMAYGTPDSEVRNTYGVGGSSIKTARELLRKAYRKAFAE